jgi:histone H3/H4
MAAMHDMTDTATDVAAGELIISKARTKAAAKRCNVSSDFYTALDRKVRDLIVEAEERALANNRKTLKPSDL